MKITLHTILILLVAVLSVGLSEVLMTVVWLPNAPVAVTSNFFLAGLLPVQLAVVGITFLLLAMVFRHRPKLYIPLYVILFCLIHALELSQFFNPLEDIARYWIAITIAALVWSLVWWKYYNGYNPAQA